MLEWNVLYEDWNTREITSFNIFNHSGFYNDCKRYADEYKDDKWKFAKEVRNSLMYYFWSKCEWEVIVSSWPPIKEFKDKKISVFDQVDMNWNIFIEYLWEHKGEQR